MVAMETPSPISTISADIATPKQGNHSAFSTVLQVFPTFLIAGLGMVAAGMVLNIVQFWPVFTDAKVIIMVPALLGLKGNLEMTLASRLSTACNMGKLEDRQEATSMILGNLVLVQTQGIVVGFLASVVGMLIGWVTTKQTFVLDHALLLCASAIVTASIASLVLGVVMVVVILLAKLFRFDPDNVATPIAASLGDVTTLGLLAWVSEMFYAHMKQGIYSAPVIIGVYLVIFLPVFMYLSYKNKHTQGVLLSGWTPVLMAMFISSGGGLVLEKAVDTFKGIAVFSPVMNGAGGNLVAIQASRMTTYLNRATNSLIGIFPNQDDHACILPCSALCGGLGSGCGSESSAKHAAIARVLLVLLFPGHMAFLFSICLLESLGVPSPLFIFLYLLAAFCQVALLLYLCQVIVYLMWRKGTDPDNAAIPYLTAIGDLVGTGFLAISFCLLQMTKDPFLLRMEAGEMLGNITVSPESLGLAY